MYTTERRPTSLLSDSCSIWFVKLPHYYRPIFCTATYCSAIHLTHLCYHAFYISSALLLPAAAQATILTLSQAIRLPSTVVPAAVPAPARCHALSAISGRRCAPESATLSRTNHESSSHAGPMPSAQTLISSQGSSVGWRRRNECCRRRSRVGIGSPSVKRIGMRIQYLHLPPNTMRTMMPFVSIAVYRRRCLIGALESSEHQRG